MAKTLRVSVMWDETVQAYRITWPYAPVLIQDFEKLVPYRDRHWDEQSRTWTLVESWYNDVMKLLQLYGCIVTSTTRQQVEAANAASPKQQPIEVVVMQFVRLTPPDAMKKAYLLGSMQLHPDRGGDKDKFAAFSTAWSRIEKEVYGKS